MSDFTVSPSPDMTSKEARAYLQGLNAEIQVMQDQIREDAEASEKIKTESDELERGLRQR